jgi:hypothetical protein
MSAAESTPSPPEPRSGPLARLKLESTARRALAAVAAVGTVIGVATGAVQLAGTLRADGPPVTARITPAKDFEPDVCWRAYRAGHPELAAGSGNRYGIVFMVDVKLGGLKHKAVALRWRAVDQDGVALATPAWVPRSLPLRPRDDAGWEVTRTVWAPEPPDVGAFKLEFSIVDQHGETRTHAAGPLVHFARF